MKQLKIAVLDSGIDIACIGLINNKVYPLEINQKNGEYQIENSIIDEEEHGSLVIQEILGGVANCNLEIYSIKILDHDLKCDIEKLIYALNYVYKNIKPDIVNLSLGYKKENIQVHNVIKRLTNMGTIMVAAYDNENEESFPANYPEVIGVKGIKNSSDPKEYIYDEKENNIYVYNGVRRFDLLGKGYKYIGGNSIACASTTALIANILCDEKMESSHIYSKLGELSANVSDIQSYRYSHKPKERILLYPLNTKTLSEIKNLNKYCTICGFLDFRKFILNTICDDKGNEYTIFNSFDCIPKEIDSIYVDEVIDYESGNINIAYETILKGALKRRINLSFYDRPESFLLKQYDNKFDKANLNIEFVNVFGKLYQNNNSEE